MKVKKLYIALLVFFGGAFFSNVSVFASENYFPTVNVVTTQNEPVELRKDLTYLSDSSQVSRTTIAWENIDPQIFEAIGTHTVFGSTDETGEKVKGLITVYPSNKQIKVAAVGDSITYGYGIGTRTTTAYPQQLNNRLGQRYSVSNYGVSSRTLLATGDYPYIKMAQYKNSLTANPDIVVIQLGTNDTRLANFKKKDSFISDYVRLIQSYKNLASKPTVYVSLPTMLFTSSVSGFDQGRLEAYLPMIMEAAKEVDLDISVIDNQELTKEASALIPDKVHPNANGAALLANNVYRSLKGVTSKTSGVVAANGYDQTYGAINSVNGSELYLSDISKNNWVSFKNVDFTKGIGKIKLEAAIPYNNTSVTIRLDSPSGPVIGTGALESTKKAATFISHEISINRVEETRDVYLVFDRPASSATAQIACLKNVEFTETENESEKEPETGENGEGNESETVSIKTEAELDTALSENRKHITFMDTITLTKNILLNDDVTMDINGKTLNTDKFYIGKNEKANKRVKVTVENGTIYGQNKLGSFYSANSENNLYGMNIDVKNINFNGVLFIRNNVNGSLVTLSGANRIDSTTGSNIYARNITFQADSTYYGSTQGGGSSNESGSTVITLGSASNVAKNVIVEKNAKVELYPGTKGTGYGQNAIFGFSSIDIQESATFIASGKQPMLRTLYTAGNANVTVRENATFDVKSSESTQGFSYSYGIDYLFDHVNYLNIESNYNRRTSFLYAYRDSSITILDDQLFGWTTTDLAVTPTGNWSNLTSLQISNIRSGKNMGIISQGSPDVKEGFGTLNNYYRISNHTN